MIEHMKFEWMMFQMHGLLPDQAEAVAWWLPIAFSVLGLLLGAVWLLRHEEAIGTVAGYGAMLVAFVTLEALMFRPVTAWLLLGTHRPDFFWVLRTYTKECAALAFAFPAWHGLLLYAYEGEIRSWLAPFRL